ncbi:prefoldin subunit 6 [Homalodisca vitripennis]|uniref:Probable prefoldin subunit 6 n=1 Tax=Homalodisca liturata TaxID=320908 RepID=A0A1B6JZ89_9HEMI|nr:prefoldin subunit 6 [Homalodisca vitripennis]
MEEIQKKLLAESDSFKIAQKDYQKALSQRQQLDAQLNENMVVKTELDLMKGEGEVFKLIGPVLVKQELEEAKQNVAKRIDYISGELKRIDNNIAAMETKVEGHRERLSKLQTRLQQEQVKAALKE